MKLLSMRLKMISRPAMKDLGLALMVAVAATATTAYASTDQWTKPTPEELSMTEQPGHPGVAAVILNREEITKDDLHAMLHYERIKVLTEKGKEYANVELRFLSSRDDGYFSGDEKSVGDIAGRTIHPDGTIIPFTGKPYLKTLEKNSEYSYQARVFTLPDVEVGSIIEYRYATRIADNIFEAPRWFIQDELFTRSAHFVWVATTHELNSEEGMVAAIAWFPILPPGVNLKQTSAPTPSGPQQTFEVVAKNIEPQPDDDYMPPIGNFTYRVLFYYTPYRTAAEYWRSKGKTWSKAVDHFAGPDDAVRAATQQVIAGATTSDAKLQNIYAKIMSFENTDYTRSHGRNEDKAAGLGKVSGAGDVLQRGRGNSTQLTELFLGMARAAGFKAYAMLVPDRARRLFTPGYLDIDQFDNLIAIVNVDGKEKFFDPGSRYCEYGHVSWESSIVQGLRQTDSGTDFAQSQAEPYTATTTKRIGDLVADANGELKGTLTMTFTGAAALEWRQRALRGDEETLRRGLRTSAEAMLPKTLEVKVETIENVQDFVKPLRVVYHVSGTAGTRTSKRWILPADIFTAEERNKFPHEKRELPVYFHYDQGVFDAVRIKYPSSMSLEGTPTAAKIPFQQAGSYSLKTDTAPDSVTTQRTFLFNAIIVPTKDYADLRTFYSQLESKDKDSIILKAASATVPATPAGN